MPDRFSNPSLTEQDLTAIQNSSADAETIARQYRLNAAEVLAIRTALDHITSPATSQLTARSSSMEAAPTSAAPTAPDPKASPY
jgi:hypothetical protein